MASFIDRKRHFPRNGTKLILGVTGRRRNGSQFYGKLRTHPTPFIKTFLLFNFLKTFDPPFIKTSHLLATQE